MASLILVLVVAEQWVKGLLVTFSGRRSRLRCRFQISGRRVAPTPPSSSYHILKNESGCCTSRLVAICVSYTWLHCRAVQSLYPHSFSVQPLSHVSVPAPQMWHFSVFSRLRTSRPLCHGSHTTSQCPCPWTSLRMFPPSSWLRTLT